MVQKPSKGWSVAAAALGGLSLVLVAVAAEVGPPNATQSSGVNQFTAVNLDATVLDRYTGDYQLAPHVVVGVTRDGNRLFAQLTGQPKAEIFARSESEFFYKIVDAQISFDTDPQGRASGLVLHQHGADMAAPRIDVANAEQINAAAAAKVQSQIATPGSEAAVRHLVAGINSGNPNYSEMSPALAKAMRAQLPQLAASLAQLGAVQSIEFRGVGNQGFDVYEVRHENGISRWKIVLGTDGIIMGALFQPGP